MTKIAMKPSGSRGNRTLNELSETDLDIAGNPYSVSVLKVGYCVSQPDGSFRADGTITLLTGPKTVLVDTGGPWDREFLLARLKEKGFEIGRASCRERG